jgi:hypothetical protein
MGTTTTLLIRSLWAATLLLTTHFPVQPAGRDSQARPGSSSGPSRGLHWVEHQHCASWVPVVQLLFSSAAGAGSSLFRPSFRCCWRILTMWLIWQGA